MEWLAYLLIGMLAGLFAGLFGIGGGIVIVPALIFVLTTFQISDVFIPHQAIATSLATIIGTAAAATVAHHRRGAVHWKIVKVLTPGILLGTWFGASAASWLSDWWLIHLFGVFLIIIAWQLFQQPTIITQQRSFPKTNVIITVGAVIGAVSAVIGIGGGTLTVPFLVRHQINIRNAIATSSACGIPIAIAGSISFIIHGWQQPELPPHSLGFIYWPAAVAIMMTSIPMATVGTRLAHRIAVTALKRWFSIVLVLIALKLLLQ
ncbi:sulfite exporter TauE/SafE family protein [Thiospirillum jenense]|uniref:Probable membrane transporter protein n=1 Tax=Thiospirillum jenense TaxID=1653858 RepID=A0A839HD48_9GAMM|nr:sulfite exporter TauE/SafE family protein [Thiospirillum jenense]MBB1126571.1 sulfite exporter TauE/SafE family protein [Thiospirillum jenense]